MTGKDYFYYDKLGYFLITEEVEGITSIELFLDKPKFEIKKSLEIEKCKIQLLQYLEGKRKYFDLKLDIRGTEFRKKVWGELLKIPYGKTISYSEQAKRVGNLKACRAVGQANGDNPLLIVIPCHRVIGKNGNLTGYSSIGGIKIKEFLLQLEKLHS